MKLKITNKWNGEVIELEGTEQELSYFMSNYKPQAYNYYPWFNQAISAPSVFSSICLMHDFDLNSTAPTCRKYGAPQTPFIPTMTYTDLPFNTTGNITFSSVTD